MKATILLCTVSLVFVGCGSSTGPVLESYYWEQYEWIPVESRYSKECQISYALHGDSIYISGVQAADTSHYCRYNMPDIVSFEILLEGEFPDAYTRDGARALTAAGSLNTDDWYEYYYPYGFSKECLEQSVPNQPDICLSGTNDVTGIFFGELNGDSTVVFRKALVTEDSNADIPLAIGSTYGLCIYLQWNSPGDPDYYTTGREEVTPITL